VIAVIGLISAHDLIGYSMNAYVVYFTIFGHIFALDICIRQGVKGHGTRCACIAVVFVGVEGNDF